MNAIIGHKCEINILTGFSLFGGFLSPLLEHVTPRLLQLDEVDLEEVPLPKELVGHLVRHHGLVMLPHAGVVHHQVRDLPLPLVQIATPRLPVHVIPAISQKIKIINLMAPMPGMNFC